MLLISVNVFIKYNGLPVLRLPIQSKRSNNLNLSACCLEAPYDNEHVNACIKAVANKIHHSYVPMHFVLKHGMPDFHLGKKKEKR